MDKLPYSAYQFNFYSYQDNFLSNFNIIDVSETQGNCISLVSVVVAVPNIRQIFFPLIFTFDYDYGFLFVIVISLIFLNS